MTFRYAHSANYSFYHQMSSKLTKHNGIKKIGHQIHRKHYITPNNLSSDLADWWNRNNYKKDTSSRGVTTFFAKSVSTPQRMAHHFVPGHSYQVMMVWSCECLLLTKLYLTIFPSKFRPFLYESSPYTVIGCYGNEGQGIYELIKLSTLKPGQNSGHFADNIFSCIFLDGCYCISN